jgi:hypothetical protein
VVIERPVRHSNVNSKNYGGKIMFKKLLRRIKHLCINYDSIAAAFLKAEKRMGTYQAELQEKAMEYRVVIAKFESKLATTETEAEKVGTAARNLGKLLG